MESISQIITDVYEFLNGRRTFPRFNAIKGVIAVNPADYSSLGPVIDLSLDGLSFYYIDRNFQSEKSLTLSLAVPKSDVVLDNLRVKTIYDFELSSKFQFGFIVMRRRGMQFQDLTREQILQLNEFISLYTK